MPCFDCFPVVGSSRERLSAHEWLTNRQNQESNNEQSPASKNEPSLAAIAKQAVGNLSTSICSLETDDSALSDESPWSCHSGKVPTLATSASAFELTAAKSFSSLNWEPCREPFSSASEHSISTEESVRDEEEVVLPTLLIANPVTPKSKPAQSVEKSRCSEFEADIAATSEVPQGLESETQPLEPNYDMKLVFSKFCGKQQKMDTAKFQKVCKDCGLFSKSFTSADADIIFMQMKRAHSKTVAGAFKLELDDFENALKLVAMKKGLKEHTVFATVMESTGPRMTFTKANAVPLHDDKRLYTGTHLNGGPDVGQKGGGNLSRRATTDLSTGARADPMPSFLNELSRRLSLEPTVQRPCQMQTVTATGNGDETGSVEQTFKSYSRDGEHMDGKSFVKLCRDCNLIGQGLSNIDIDLIFAKFKVRSLRHMDIIGFKKALQFIAYKKEESNAVVSGAVAHSAGPVLTGTRAGKNRFYELKRKSTADWDDDHSWLRSLRATSKKERLPRFVAQRVGDFPEEPDELNEAVKAEFQQERRRLRDSVKTRPPLDTEDVTMVFTDVQGSSSLWESNPKAMELALRIHDATIRRNMALHLGYEVTTEGDAFQIVFHDAFDAVGFCLDVQADLYNCEQWPEGILGHPDACVCNGTWRGLRVRMGIHSGRPLPPTKHEVTGRYRYAGKSVAIAKAVEEACHGGQILLSDTAFSKINGLLTQLQSPQVVDLGEHILHVHGLADATNQTEEKLRLLQLVPSSLAHDYFSCPACSPEGAMTCTGGRIFPPVISKKQISQGFQSAPAGSLITLCFVFTKGARDLVASDPQLGGHALSMLRKCVRDLLGRSPTTGYECQEDEGAFMLAFTEFEKAVAFGAALQQQLPQLPWQSELLECSPVFAKGLRVGVGALQGSYTSRGPHASTGRADYFGPLVNRTARIAQSAHAGQSLYGLDAEDALNESMSSLSLPVRVSLKRLGSYAFKGIEMPLVVHELRAPDNHGMYEDFPEPKTKGRVGD